MIKEELGKNVCDVNNFFSRDWNHISDTIQVILCQKITEFSLYFCLNIESV